MDNLTLEEGLIDGWEIIEDTKWAETNAVNDILAALGFQPVESDIIEQQTLILIYRVIIDFFMRKMYGQKWEEQNPKDYGYPQMLDVFKRLDESLRMHSYVRYESLEGFGKSTMTIISAYEKEIIDSRKSWRICSAICWTASTAFSVLQYVPYLPYGAVGCAMVSQVGVVGAAGVAIEAGKIAAQLALKSASSIRYLIWLLTIVI
jgi:hypothetical protein